MCVLLHLMEHQLHWMFWLLDPFFIMFSFWGLLDLATQREFELTMCSENFLCDSLSSGNTPLVKKVSCGVEFCRVWSPVVRAGITKGWISSDGNVPTDLRGCSVKRYELENGSFLPPYLQVY